ncbi:cadherin-related family member 5 isoform X2 [Austrofundulus limnaeus]|uniref:Cadherin-related family member 5 isoform X2 n=1 Tax=Austrofundulus limnaeus TaxID=52670 RepID=A0A2I4CQ74_AUSLI|nr:PREDICTED: cadherin-related family member 5-like isoform X2 [Austrofundulus limnaeus]
MDGIYPFFLCLLLLQTASVAAQICSPPTSVDFAENNKVGDVVLSFTAEPGTVVTYAPENNPSFPFEIVENQLRATAVLDYETMSRSFPVMIVCMKEGAQNYRATVVVLLRNVNDNPPVFAQSVYPTPVNELLPIDSHVGRFDATDLDNDRLYYRLTPESTYFKLRTPTSSEILVNALLDYDKLKEVELLLEAQDTPLTTTEEPSFTATTTIIISISDVDNRPPWYQPCNKYEVGGVMVCQSAGYTGRVNLNEQEPGVLPLKPGPLYAVDGDNGINEEITYSFLSGNEANLFQINPNTGNITMQKPADILGPISLTVLAAQRINSHQFATTTLTIQVTVKSLHKPKFQHTLYDALITSKGSTALSANDNLPLEILATDEDYSSTGGRNPHITYSVEGSDGFSIVGGFLFLTKDLPDGTLSLQILAIDTSNDETATAQLNVEVKLKMPSGEFRVLDMVALGASLGILLFISLVVIALLVYYMHRGKADWKKIQEVTMFRSSLGQSSGGKKEGMQFTNETFQKDEDEGSMGSGGPNVSGGNPPKSEWNNPPKDLRQERSAPLAFQLPDGASDNGSDRGDDEKDVKPILTKERRVEEGYKSVWFKEDIDPNAKEEVVIIPDSREDDSEGEDELSSRNKTKAPKVGFADPDLDSGLGVKMGGPGEDSGSDLDLNVDL